MRPKADKNNYSRDIAKNFPLLIFNQSNEPIVSRSLGLFREERRAAKERDFLKQAHCIYNASDN